MRQSLQQLAIQYGRYDLQQSVRESLHQHRNDCPEEHQARRDQPGQRK
ncbi:hypothetical protein [Paenibacillus marinisediminis]